MRLHIAKSFGTFIFLAQMDIGEKAILGLFIRNLCEFEGIYWHGNCDV